MKRRSITGVLLAFVTLTFGITYCLAAAAQQVELQSAKDEVKVLIGGKHVTSYLYQNSLTKPVLYPLKTLGGTTLNRGYPLVKVEGETTDHAHHLGVFFTYDEVNDSGFWNNKSTPPQVKHIKIIKVQSGPSEGKLSAISHWIAKDGKTVLLEEKRTMVFQPISNGYTIDCQMDLTAKTKVEFGDTKEGMFAIRTADWLREKGGTGKYISSEGAQGAGNIWGRRAEWVAIEGRRENQKVGVAILNHPSSINYPTFWHARNYGLFSANPLGQAAFQKGTKAKEVTPLHLTLAPGKTAHFRFLVMVYDGEGGPEKVETVFKKYTR